jgi:hypothetical protein
MRKVSKPEVPNAATIAAIRELDAGKGSRHASAEELFAYLGIEERRQDADDDAPRFRRIVRQ